MAPPTTSSKYIAYFFTSFPKLSEQFLERELAGLSEHTDLQIHIYTLIGTGDTQFKRFPIFRFGIIDWLTLPFRFLHELVRRPSAFHKMAQLNDAYLPRSSLNALEHYLGLAFAILRAAKFRKYPPERIHAVWATGPASAAYFLYLLNGTPFSMGCHAYDLFRFGGDILLPEKIRAACFIQTSTTQARDELIARGAPPEKVCLIRRSAPEEQTLSPPEPPVGRGNTPRPVARPKHQSAIETPIRILCVGRLVEKKGYRELLTILHRCAETSIPFTARIIGEGPLRRTLQQEIENLQLQEHVQLVGQMPYHAVEDSYRNFADVFFFTGKTASTGDRDGLPNVIIEAMVAGVPVFASDTGAVVEAIQPGETGERIDTSRPELWAAALLRLAAEPDYRIRLQQGARNWVEMHCDPRRNALALAARLLS